MATAENVFQLRDVALLIFSHLDAQDLCTAARVCKGWRELAEDESLWRYVCNRDWGITAAIRPPQLLPADGAPAPASFRDAYRAWYGGFGKHLPAFRHIMKRASSRDNRQRAARCMARSVAAWQAMERWTEENIPGIRASLRDGIDAEELDRLEYELGRPLPDALRALYLVHNGQDLAFDDLIEEDIFSGTARGRRSLPENVRVSEWHGLFGSYMHYDRRVSVRLMPLERGIKYTAFLGERGMVPEGESDFVLVAASANFARRLFVELDTGMLWVNVGPGRSHTTVCPEDDPTGAEGNPFFCTNDGVLRWTEKYAANLLTGVFGARWPDENIPVTAIMLYPNAGDQMGVAVTNNVEVRASAVYCMEASMPSQGSHFLSYSIRMRMLGPIGDPANPISTCQLDRRHWEITDMDGHTETVDGEAVIGKKPILEAHGEEFFYQSCTEIHRGGSMRGFFLMYPGTVAHPKGVPFEAVVPQFPLSVPDGYVF